MTAGQFWIASQDSESNMLKLLILLPCHFSAEAAMRRGDLQTCTCARMQASGWDNQNFG